MLEIKLSNSNSKSTTANAILDRICQKDGEYHQNVITSLYFDTIDWASAMEKASSDYLKTKVRIRYYYDKSKNSYSSPFLEIKQKEGAIRHKERIELDGIIKYQDLWDVSQTQRLIKLVNNLVPNIQTYIPAIFVQYSRSRYVEPLTKSRVALDSGITGELHPSQKSLMDNKTQLSECVFEMKGEHRKIPASLVSLIQIGFRPAAFSKYYLCYCNLSGYTQ